jgi:integrase
MLISRAVEMAWKEVLEHHSETSHSTYKAIFKAIGDRWGSLRLGELTRQHVQTYVNERKGSASASTIVSEITAINKIYRAANETGCDFDPPTSRLRKPRVDNKREKIVERCDAARLQSALGEHWALALFAMMTGIRRLELFRLRPEDLRIWETDRQKIASGVVVWRRGIATIRTSKTGKGRQLPLNAVAAAIAFRWRREGSPWLVFAEEEERFRAARKFYDSIWKPATRRAGLAGLHFHDLRHTAASWAGAEEASLQDIQLLLGHDSITQTERYVHHIEARIWPAALALQKAWLGNKVP